MKKQHNFRSYLLGVLTSLMVFGLATPTLAAAAQKTIQVSSGVRIYIDDVELRPTDANGNPVEVFVYNGTTYLPARAVSEALGKPVQWDGSTQSVYIGKHSSDTPAAYLSEIDHFTKSGYWQFNELTKDNLGNDHTHSIRATNYTHSGYATYKLNGQYSRLTALYYQRYERRDDSASKNIVLVISGDGKQLWQGSVNAGMDPMDIDIDITGVLELTLEYPNGSRCAYYTALGDVALWS